MIALPPPMVESYDGILVVRDDAIEGGTKRRVLPSVLAPWVEEGQREFVYASPAQGYAQAALSITCRDMGVNATIFVAKRREVSSVTKIASVAGAKVVQVFPGYLSNVRSKARSYCELTGAQFVPFGVDTELFIDGLVEVARSVDVDPSEVWCVSGSGTLARSLQRAWPKATINAVQVGIGSTLAEGIVRHVAPEKFEQDAREPPPFPSCSNYDAKAWAFIKRHASPGALFWNVAR